MSIYSDATLASIRNSTDEVRADMKRLLAALSMQDWDNALDLATETAGIAGNLEGEVEAYVNQKRSESG